MEIVFCKINNIYIYKIDIALIPKKYIFKVAVQFGNIL